MTGTENAGNYERLEQLTLSGHSCIRMVTDEEGYILELIESFMKNRTEPLWYWSAVQGLYEGFRYEPKPVPNTENAAAGLYWLTNEMKEPGTSVMGI